MDYSVYVTKNFEKEISFLSEKEKRTINKIFQKLKTNPCSGDAIRYKFFREKRLKEKRIYYLVYDDLKIVLIVAFGGKKMQKETIDKIVKNFPKYREYAIKMFS